MGVKKLIFDYNNFFGSGHISIIFSDLIDQKMVWAKKVVMIKNQFFFMPINQMKEYLKSIHTGVVFLQFFDQSF